MLIRSNESRKKLSKLNEKMMELEREQNKEVESYPRVLSVSANSPKTKMERTNVPYPQKSAGIEKKTMQHDLAKKTMESKKAHIKNLSDYDLTRDEINQFCQGGSTLFLHP